MIKYEKLYKFKKEYSIREKIDIKKDSIAGNGLIKLLILGWFF
jgi:hypothetical protein